MYVERERRTHKVEQVQVHISKYGLQACGFCLLYVYVRVHCVCLSLSLDTYTHIHRHIYVYTFTHTHTVTYLLVSSMSRLFVVGPQPLAEVLKNLSRTVPGTALAGPQSCSCHSGHLEAVPAPGLSVCLSSSRFPPVRFLCLLLCLRSKNLTLKPRCF